MRRTYLHIPARTNTADARVARTRWRLAVTFSILAAGSAAPVAAQTAGSGYGWDALEQRIDQKVVDYMEANDVAGMTVAISKNGRLVLSKGYGGKSAAGGTDMAHDTRTLIGSTSKPLITGPTGVEMLARLGIDPATKKLYGAGGVFPSTFAIDRNYGVNRHVPVVATAIGPENRVYSWLHDGTYIVGASFDLQKHQKPKPYELPEGKTPADIVDIAISGSGSITTFFTDGTIARSFTPFNLGTRIRKSGKPSEYQQVSIPGGRSILNVVGIGQAKSNDKFYFWYDDRKVSAGSFRDADSHRAPYGYSLSESTPYRIRGMGIAADDKIYTWLTNATAQSGTSDDLDRHKKPYSVVSGLSGPYNPNVFNWYASITLQHLLDHKAGFQRSGDAVGAATMFGGTKDTVSYTDAHRYMLRTRPLSHAPGTAYAYSNHGFGLWTIIVPQLSGKSYASTAMQDYLIAKVGLSASDVRPRSKTPDARDATPMYLDDNGVFGTHPHKDAGIGLAAGGWTASAGDMLRITEYLTSAYSFTKLGKMGWHVDGSGTKTKLDHNGRIGGGTSYVALFKPGYVSTNGTDLSDIQIAVATNIWTDTGALKGLVNDIVFDVPAANISPAYDAWARMN